MHPSFDFRPAGAFVHPSRPGCDSAGHPETRTFGELLIDLEEDKAARAVVFGLLREMESK
jgi:hypothetical protein